MTYIDNLASIIENGLLSHKEAYAQKRIEVDISDPNVQDIRAKKIEPRYKRPLHEYVPLYFSPRNPMLYAKLYPLKERGNIITSEIDSKPNPFFQEDIIILGIDPQLLSKPNTLFTDGNAASEKTKFYTGSQKLDQLPWQSIRAASWNNDDIKESKRVKCAEVLVYPKIQPSRIQMIFSYSDKHRQTIIAAKQGTPIMGEVNRNLYF